MFLPENFRNHQIQMILKNLVNKIYNQYKQTPIIWDCILDFSVNLVHRIYVPLLQNCIYKSESKKAIEWLYT